MMTADLSSPGSGQWTGGVHGFRLRVYYEDTDALGIVYHANYLKFAERARTEMLRLCGTGQDQLRREEGLGFAVRRCEIDFRASARLDDLLEVRTTLREARGARVAAVQSIHRVGAGGVNADWLVRLELMLACVKDNGRPSRLPEHVRAAFAAILNSDC